MADELGGLLRTLDPYYSRDVITLTAGASVEQALESLWPDYDRIILAPAGPNGSATNRSAVMPGRRR